MSHRYSIAIGLQTIGLVLERQVRLSWRSKEFWLSNVVVQFARAHAHIDRRGAGAAAGAGRIEKRGVCRWGCCERDGRAAV